MDVKKLDIVVRVRRTGIDTYRGELFLNDVRVSSVEGMLPMLNELITSGIAKLGYVITEGTDNYFYYNGFRVGERIKGEYKNIFDIAEAILKTFKDTLMNVINVDKGLKEVAVAVDSIEIFK